jgi:hypothetical protein
VITKQHHAALPSRRTVLRGVTASAWVRRSAVREAGRPERVVAGCVRRLIGTAREANVPGPVRRAAPQRTLRRVAKAAATREWKRAVELTIGV